MASYKVKSISEKPQYLIMCDVVPNGLMYAPKKFVEHGVNPVYYNLRNGLATPSSAKPTPGVWGQAPRKTPFDLFLYWKSEALLNVGFMKALNEAVSKCRFLKCVLLDFPAAKYKEEKSCGNVCKTCKELCTEIAVGACRYFQSNGFGKRAGNREGEPH
jgi:hypothetical protein